MVQLIAERRNEAGAATVVGRAMRGLVKDVAPLNNLATRMGEVRGAARRALKGAANKLIDADVAAAVLSPAASTSPVSLSRAYSPLRHGNFAAMIPGDSAVETVITSGLYSTLNIYNTLLIGRLILTWFPNPPRAIVYPLATMCDPYLNLFRGIIPPIGGTIDLSPILAFVTLSVFTNSAAALPCEVNADGSVKQAEPRTHAGKLWAKRVMAKMAARKGAAATTAVEEASK
mmetsp:Transcript_17008/g.27287  ORF Transcript_17008/g.27287 Transcript_17008/m.27287 type:complete len:231 (-) Transcript_17008:136-828(-)